MTTSSRGDFLSTAAAGSALAGGGVFSGETLAAAADISRGGGGRYVLPGKFGLGGVPLGNEFELVSDEDAYKTLEAAWNAGVRYYDVSPWYGLGLGERRYGNFAGFDGEIERSFWIGRAETWARLRGFTEQDIGLRGGEFKAHIVQDVFLVSAMGTKPRSCSGSVQWRSSPMTLISDVSLA
jgi:hypothetical protein